MTDDHDYDLMRKSYAKLVGDHNGSRTYGGPIELPDDPDDPMPPPSTEERREWLARRAAKLARLFPPWTPSQLWAHYGIEGMSQFPSPVMHTNEFARISYKAEKLGLGKWGIDGGVWPVDAAKDFLEKHPDKGEEVNALHERVKAEWKRVKLGKAIAGRLFRERKPLVEQLG
jgi:hypothetical protein